MGIKYMIHAILLALALIVGATNAAKAIGRCAIRDMMIDTITKDWKEAPKARALNGRGAALEVFVATNGNFTIILTFTNKVSCVIAAGVDWEDIVSEPIPEGDPA